MASCPGNLDQDSAVPDYRDGRHIRAFTPVFDGLLPSHNQAGTATRFAADTPKGLTNARRADQ
jgi:hypothetical protein